MDVTWANLQLCGTSKVNQDWWKMLDVEEPGELFHQLPQHPQGDLTGIYTLAHLSGRDDLLMEYGDFIT